MDWLQRKIRKELKKQQPDFKDWYERELAVSGRFNVPSGGIQNGSALIRTRKVWLPLLTFLWGIIVCLAIALPLIFSSNVNDMDLTFGESDVYTEMLSEDEFELISEEYPFVQKMQTTLKDNLRLYKDNSLVMVLLQGEVGTEYNYFLLSVQIVYNKNYEFAYKPIYEELSSSTHSGEWSITYENTSIDFNGLYVYLLRLENLKGQVIYIEAHCFENDISYILNDFI